MQGTSYEELQARINSRNPALQTLPTYLPAPALPADAVVLNDEVIAIQFQTDYNAREIGVFIGGQLPTAP